MIDKYEIWQAQVKFEDIDEMKNRPVLILVQIGDQITAYKATGTDRGDSEVEYKLRNWREAGLTKPTSIRITKMLKLSESDLLYKIGKLSEEDIMRLELRLAMR